MRYLLAAAAMVFSTSAMAAGYKTKEILRCSNDDEIMRFFHVGHSTGYIFTEDNNGKGHLEEITVLTDGGRWAQCAMMHMTLSSKNITVRLLGMGEGCPMQVVGPQGTECERVP